MKPVLVVDDEAIVRESIRDWLVESGYSIETAADGKEALERVDEKDFGVVVVDLRLPDMHGIDVIKQIKAKHPGMKSIIITAYPTDLSQKQARELGHIDYLVKPVAPDELERLIKATLDQL